MLMSLLPRMTKYHTHVGAEVQMVLKKKILPVILILCSSNQDLLGTSVHLMLMTGGVCEVVSAA